MNNFSFRVPEKAGGGMPTYQQQQQYPTPGVDVSARLSDSAAQIYQQGAAQQAKGLEKLGQGMEQAAKAGYDLYTDYQTSQAREAFNEYRAEEMQQQAKLSGLSGKDAIDEKSGVQASIAAWQQEARERLGKNLGGMARGMFDNATQTHGAKFTAWGMEKTQTEQRTYMNQQDEGTIALDAQSMLANPMDGTTIRNSLANIEGRYNAMRDRNGWSDEYAKAKMNGQTEQIFSKMVLNQINAENLGAAKTLLNNFGDRMGGSRGALEAHISAKGRELAARARADQERTQRLDAMNTARTLLNDFGGNSEQALEWIKNNAKGTEQQLQYTSAYLTQRNILDAATAQKKQESTIAAQNDITSKIQAAGTDVTALNTIIAEASPELKNFAMAHAEQAVGKQRRTISDPTAWNDAHSSILRGEPYEIVMGRNVGKISDPDADKLRTLAEDKGAKANATENKLYFDKIWSASSHARITDVAERNQNKDQLQYEVERRLRGVTDPQKARDIIFDVVHDRSVPGLIWGTNDINSIKARDYDIGEVKISIPSAARDSIEKQAKRMGKTLTEKDIMDVYLTTVRGGK